MNINQFAKQLESATSEQQARAILREYLEKFKFKSYAFTYYSFHIKSGSKLRYEFASDALKPWHSYYLEQGFADVDRTLEETNAMTLPLLWDVNTQHVLAKNNREQRVRLESIEYGAHRGLSIPVHGPHNDFAILLLHQRKNEHTLENYQEHQFEWLSAAHIFYHTIKRILDLNETPSKIFNLTKREEQCLTLTLKSWRVEQIAKSLNISERTVNFHIQNANKKMGVNNKYQAAYKFFDQDKN